MKSLKRRVDEFSVQYTLEGSKLFFIRVDAEKSAKGSLVFTDFSFDRDDYCYVLVVIYETMKEFHDCSINIKICDIAPNHQSVLRPNAEVVRRYDSICEIMNIAMLAVNYRIEKCNLDYRLDRFDIMLSATMKGKPL